MSPTLRQEIAKLTHDERVDLIDELLIATARDGYGFTPEQALETDRRLASLDEDRKSAVPWAVIDADFEARSKH